MSRPPPISTLAPGAGAGTLAALATIPTREHLLPQVLRSLRPQVARLCVVLNGHAAVPAVARELADDFVRLPSNLGAEGKFRWAGEHKGVYLSCDDDFVYRAPYVATMVDAVRQWGGRAIVTGHGRTFLGQPTSVHRFVPGSRGMVHQAVRRGRWVNHGGTGVMAWDTERVPVPSGWPVRNCSDMQVAVWAQEQGVPMWLVPHSRGWVTSLASLDPEGIFMTSKAAGFPARTRLLVEHGERAPWRLHVLEQVERSGPLVQRLRG